MKKLNLVMWIFMMLSAALFVVNGFREDTNQMIMCGIIFVSLQNSLLCARGDKHD